MSKSKIEIFSRDVRYTLPVPFLGKAQHLFIVYTDSTGYRIFLRGGPQSDNVLSGDLEFTRGSYIHGSIDWEPTAPSRVIASGTDAEMQALVDKMWAKAEAINKEGFDYKLPPIGHVQNCNTAVAEMVKAAGPELKLPTHHSRIQVN